MADFAARRKRPSPLHDASLRSAHAISAAPWENPVSGRLEATSVFHPTPLFCGNCCSRRRSPQATAACRRQSLALMLFRTLSAAIAPAEPPMTSIALSVEVKVGTSATSAFASSLAMSCPKAPPDVPSCRRCLPTRRMHPGSTQALRRRGGRDQDASEQGRRPFLRFARMTCPRSMQPDKPKITNIPR